MADGVIRQVLAGAIGFEPMAFGFGDRRSNQLSYAPAMKIQEHPLAVSIRDRTEDLWSWKPALYQLSYTPAKRR